MGWCFNPMPTGELMAGCHRMGMTAMEGIERKFYPELRKIGMKPSLISSHGFKDGPSSRDNHAACLAKLREAIDVAVEFGAPGVITFTGMRVKDLSDEQMAKTASMAGSRSSATPRRRGEPLPGAFEFARQHASDEGAPRILW